MRKIKNESGRVYGPWLVIDRVFPNYDKNGTARWKVKCRHCGNMHVYSGNVLRFGRYGARHVCGGEK